MFLVVKDPNDEIYIIDQDYKKEEPYNRYVTVMKIPVKTLVVAELIYKIQTEGCYNIGDVIQDLRDYFGSKIDEREPY